MSIRFVNVDMWTNDADVVGGRFGAERLLVGVWVDDGVAVTDVNELVGDVGDNIC